jgi:predicted TIM-barrel fold metal-dependent hydrolase
MQASADAARRRALLAVVAFLALALLGRTLIPAWGPGLLVHRILGHVPILAVLVLVAPLAWVYARKGRRGAAAVVAGAGLLGLALYALARIDTKFPRHQLFSPAAYADAARVVLGRDFVLSKYSPEPFARPPSRSAERAKYPVIDLHFHLGSLAPDVTPERLVQAMDSVGVEAVVNLDGAPKPMDSLMARFRDAYPNRFLTFANPELWRMGSVGFREGQLAWLERAARNGARGIKVFKELGLSLKDEYDRLVPVDDPRLDFIWERATELGWPVLMHLGDPPPFFQPVDQHNERLAELLAHPGWSYYGADFPPRDSLLAQRERLIARHPRTTFIGAHFGDNAADLDGAAELLDRYPNYHVEFASRLSDLGRQPRRTREFFIRYQDRIMFGSDGGYALGRTGWPVERFYRRHFEFLETANEMMDYPLAEITRQGDWKISGLELPDTVLRKIYRENVLRLLPSAEAVRKAAATPAPSAAARAPGALACGGRPVGWARAAGESLTHLPADSGAIGTPDYRGDSVRVGNYRFRVGADRGIVATGLVRNLSGDTIEIRGFRAEYPTPSGAVAGARECLIRMGYEHCGLGSINIRPPGYIALHNDTLPAAPDGARTDTARVFWSYCTR